MRKSPEECKAFVEEIVSYYPRVLPAVEVIHEANRIAAGWLKVVELGQSRQGHAIQVFSQQRSENPAVLLYGFPDPGEAVGGTGMLSLMRALKENHPFLSDLHLHWNFIPCLNFDDQPDGGKTLEKVMKTGEQEVDWLVHQPRPETSALLDLAKQLKPKFVFPLHDEWHSHEEIPCYMPVSKPLSRDICESLRTLLESFGLEVSKDVHDPVMGNGFLNMRTIGDIENSTFFEFGKNGLVFICEVPDLEGKPDSNVIAAQLASVIYVVSSGA